MGPAARPSLSLPALENITLLLSLNDIPGGRTNGFKLRSPFLGHLLTHLFCLNYVSVRERNNFTSTALPLISSPRYSRSCNLLVRHPFALIAAWVTRSIRCPCTAMPKLLGASAIASPVAIPPETHHIKPRIPDSPRPLLIACQPECTLAPVLSPPLQKHIEEETASQHANRFKDHQSHGARSKLSLRSYSAFSTSADP